MRLLMVEKKVAAGFGFNDRDLVEQNQHSEDTHERDAENPLLKSLQEQTYIIPPEQPWVIKSYPIIYCFADVRMLTASWITLIQATLMGALDATVPTVSEEYYGFNSSQTGLMFIPILLPTLIIGPVSGWITDRQGSKPTVVLGFGLLVPIFISLRIVQPGGPIQISIFCIILSLCGTCLAATSPPALVESTLEIKKYHKANPGVFGANGPHAQISSITGFMYNAGTALGPLLAGALKESVGYGNMNLAAAALSLITALLGFFYTGGKSMEVAD